MSDRTRICRYEDGCNIEFAIPKEYHQRIKKWLAEHDCAARGAEDCFGVSAEYVLVPTSVGTILHVVCAYTKCRAKLEDVGDLYDNW